MIISILSRKGGVGKSVGAMHLAACLEKLQIKAAVVDFDPEGTALSWSRRITLPFPVFAASELQVAVSSGRTVIIDTPPNDPKILGMAARAADICLVMARTNALEADRLKPTLDALAASGFNGPWGVVLTQAPTGKLGPAIKEALETAEIPVLGTIPSSVEYQRSFGEVPTRLAEFEVLLNTEVMKGVLE